MALMNISKKNVAPEKQFLEFLHAGLISANAPEKLRQKEKRRKFFSASGIGYCLRESYYKHIASGEEPDDPTFIKKVNLGSLTHELYQDYLQHSGRLFGNFYCRYCQKITGPSLPPKTPCECGRAPVGKLPKYSELSIIHPKLRVSGHPDGFIKIDKRLHLIEIKTISPFYKIGDSINNVKKYVPQHIRQANFYSGICQEPDTIFEEGTKDLFLSLFDPSYYILCYADKGKDSTVPYQFNYDPEMFAEDKGRVKKFWEAVKSKTPPDAEPMMGGCKYCKALDACNALKGH